ncbi:MAG: DUF4416 family protein [bacterium]
MRPTDPIPVKLFIGALYSNADLLAKAVQHLSEEFGEIDYQSPEFEFTISEYYKEEMGWPIFRKFFSLENLINPKELARIKIHTNEIEDRLAVDNKRKVNLDPGYLDYNKVVLASAKYNAQKIYLDFGIYADPTLCYEKGHFTPYPFAFPDFKSDAYKSTFLHIRALYKRQGRSQP